MNKLYLFLIIFFITSCGGGGSSDNQMSGQPSKLIINIGLSSFSIDEDNIFNGNLNVSANETSTFDYSIVTPPNNGSLSFNNLGNFTYEPKSNFNGEDNFKVLVTSREKNISQDGIVNIVVNPVNDQPNISFFLNTTYSEESLFYDSNQIFKLMVEDIDNELEDLSFSLNIGEESLPASFIPDDDYSISKNGELFVDLSLLKKAGLHDVQIIVSDTKSTNFLTFTSWFAAHKSNVIIEQDVDPEDGFDGGEKVLKNYSIYYLLGSPSSLGRTLYLFVGDSLEGIADINLYRRALIASLNKLNSSDALSFFNNHYFTIVSAEPMQPDGTSPVAVRTGCYDWDEDIYCIGELDTSIFNQLFQNSTLQSIFTKVQGRGVNLGSRNIQKITDSNPEDTSNTLMHELGHAHGYMGDEYRTTDERDVSGFANYNINTSTQSNISLLKWNHHIEDSEAVLGIDLKVCYNTSDGRIYDRDLNEYISGTDCNCYANEWDDSGNFIRKNPECGKVGLFEGNYYGKFDNYRPTFCSIMDSCNEGGYGKVNAEGFAVGSIQNQGFYDAFYDAGYSSDPDNNDFGFTSDGNGWKMTVQADYDTSKITLKWYVNGQEQPSLENQKIVTFSRPVNDEVQIYTAKAIDLTGTVIATDDVLDNTDFYEGLFQSYFVWCADYDGTNCNDWRYDPNPSEYSEFDYGFMDGPLGFSWGINWKNW